jgi:tetratricopeptide (TPR) repeat protein
MLLAKQALIDVYVQWNRLDTNPEDVQAFIEETLSRQRQLLAPTDAHLLWTECLKASDLAYRGKVDEAVSQYERLVEQLGKALHPGHPINMAAIHNLGNFYWWAGDRANAGKQYEQSMKLFLEYEGPNYLDTQIVVDTVSQFRHETGDLEGELECLKILAEGSEATYGLANRVAIAALSRLELWYRRAGRTDEAEAITEKINEGERMLEDANIL